MTDAAYWVCTVLDPHFKLSYFEDDDPSRVNKQDPKEILDHMAKIYKSYENKFAPKKSAEPAPPKSSYRYLPFLEKPVPKKEVTSEIQEYLSEPQASGDMTVLEYWKINASRFPILSLMARDYLATSPVGTPTERLFSRTGKLLRPERSRMSGKYARQRQLLAEWKRYFGPLTHGKEELTTEDDNNKICE
jgi:hypothetical protein